MTAGGRAGASGRVAFRLVVVAGIVVASGAVLAVWVARAVRTSTQLGAPVLARQYRTNLEQFHCLVAEVHREVPRGSAVYIGGGYDGQVLSELVVRWAEPAPSGRAAWRLALRRTGPCAGEQVRASRT